jgi:UMF1 family MFS transporter
MAAPTMALFAWALYDFANSAFATVIETFVFPAYFTRQIAASEAAGTSQWGLMLGLAGLVVAIGGPILGAAADQSGRRKPWLLAFTLLCAVATGLLWFVTPGPGQALPALLLVALGILGAEFAVIFYNALLPDLAGAARVGRWSGWGWALGYGGGLLCLLLTLFVLVRPDPPLLPLDPTTAEPVRASFVLVALWLLVFSLPLFLFVREPPGRGKTLGRAVRDGLKQLGHTLREARRYGELLRFLIARMIYIDGLATLFSFGGVYAAGTFEMSAEEVLLFGIGLNVTAGIGAAAFAWIDDLLGAKRTILLALAGLILPSAAILFVQDERLFWALGLILGIFVGPAQAASRSYLARMAPPALVTEMFGLFAFSGKATAFAGPFLVSGLTWASGSQRVGMSTILAFFVIGFALMLTVPTDHPARD